jgi:hypothetical protein
MQIRAIDANGDWECGQGTESYNFGEAAIAENIETRIKSFLDNCFFDMGAGIDWWTYFGIPGQQQKTLLSIQAVILQSYGVVKINSANLNLNDQTRAAVITFNINTIYSQNYTQSTQVNSYAD